MKFYKKAHNLWRKKSNFVIKNICGKFKQTLTLEIKILTNLGIQISFF